VGGGEWRSLKDHVETISNQTSQDCVKAKSMREKQRAKLEQSQGAVGASSSTEGKAIAACEKSINSDSNPTKK